MTATTFPLVSCPSSYYEVVDGEKRIDSTEGNFTSLYFFPGQSGLSNLFSLKINCRKILFLIDLSDRQKVT